MNLLPVSPHNVTLTSNTTEIPSNTSTVGIQLTTQNEIVTEIDELSTTSTKTVENTTEKQNFEVNHEVDI